MIASAASLMASPALADKLPLSVLSSYLNGFKTAQSPFTQYNADGSRSRGTLYIQRPGRARFEYDGADEALVMAGGGQIAIFDGKSNTHPQQFPLKRTPLNIILAQTVNLGADRMVTGHQFVNGRTAIVARDPENPQTGSIELYFNHDPVVLHQWIITDESGSRTAVVLDGLRTGQSLRSSLFNIPIEISKRER